MIIIVPPQQFCPVTIWIICSTQKQHFCQSALSDIAAAVCLYWPAAITASSLETSFIQCDDNTRRRRLSKWDKRTRLLRKSVAVTPVVWFIWFGPRKPFLCIVAFFFAQQLSFWSKNLIHILSVINTHYKLTTSYEMVEQWYMLL